MSKHTPGPWAVDDGGRSISSDAATDISILNRGNIRFGWSGSDVLTESHRAANARLIAAAPELLELLSRYVRQDRILGMTENGLHREACETLFKATGEQL